MLLTLSLLALQCVAPLPLRRHRDSTNMKLAVLLVSLLFLATTPMIEAKKKPIKKPKGCTKWCDGSVGTLPSQVQCESPCPKGSKKCKKCIKCKKCLTTKCVKNCKKGKDKKECLKKCKDECPKKGDPCNPNLLGTCCSTTYPSCGLKCVSTPFKPPAIGSIYTCQ